MTKLWYVPITLVEYGRYALVEADSVAEARLKAKATDWTELTDAKHFKVTVLQTKVDQGS